MDVAISFCKWYDPNFDIEQLSKLSAQILVYIMPICEIFRDRFIQSVLLIYFIAKTFMLVIPYNIHVISNIIITIHNFAYKTSEIFTVLMILHLTIMQNIIETVIIFMPIYHVIFYIQVFSVVLRMIIYF